MQPRAAREGLAQPDVGCDSDVTFAVSSTRVPVSLYLLTDFLSSNRLDKDFNVLPASKSKLKEASEDMAGHSKILRVVWALPD